MASKGTLTPEQAEALGVPRVRSVISPVSGKQLEALRKSKNASSPTPEKQPASATSASTPADPMLPAIKKRKERRK